VSGRPIRRDLTDPLVDEAFYGGDPFPHYARLRAEAPLVWHPEPGFWVASRHADVLAVSTDSATYSSSKGILALEIGIEYPTPPTMMHVDPPEHTAYRQRLAPAFRPSRMAALEERVAERVSAVVDGVALDVDIDGLLSLAVPLPLMVIADLLGVDRDEWPRFYEWSEATIPDATDWPEERKAALRADMEAHLMDVVARRRAEPREDLISDLVGDGQLADHEVWMFLQQLLVAGNETTRNLIAGGLQAFCEHPGEWARLRADRSLVPTAVDELLRWTTPVVAFMRTATRDVRLGGDGPEAVDVAAGDPVVMLYASANRDEAQFGSTADTLDVGRAPNHHLAFGFGTHYCIGAALARMEARLLLAALLDRVERIEAAGEARRTPSSIIAGWQALPLHLAAA